MFPLRKMSSFKVCTMLMTLFHQRFIESVISYCVIVWFDYIRSTGRNRMTKLIKTASKVIGDIALRHFYR